MKRRNLAPALALLLWSVSGFADEPPQVEHQAAPCTVPGQPLSLCARISDDRNVATARLYFRRAGQAFYAFVDMAFTGVSYCGTLPAPRPQTRAIDYYVQAVDDSYQPARTRTFRLPVQPASSCAFPPVEVDRAKSAAIKVFATNAKQDRKLDDGFAAAGVTFVPVGR